MNVGHSPTCPPPVALLTADSDRAKTPPRTRPNAGGELDHAAFAFFFDTTSPSSADVRPVVDQDGVVECVANQRTLKPLRVAKLDLDCGDAKIEEAGKARQDLTAARHRRCDNNAVFQARRCATD
jgi:hypothetical protein